MGPFPTHYAAVHRNQIIPRLQHHQHEMIVDEAQLQHELHQQQPLQQPQEPAQQHNRRQEDEQQQHQLHQPQQQPVPAMHAHNPQHRRGLAHFIARQNEAFQFPPQHYLGPMNSSCDKCYAKYFPQETNTRGLYTKCCQSGTVFLPPLRPRSQEIIDLFTGTILFTLAILCLETCSS